MFKDLIQTVGLTYYIVLLLFFSGDDKKKVLKMTS